MTEEMHENKSAIGTAMTAAIGVIFGLCAVVFVMGFFRRRRNPGFARNEVTLRLDDGQQRSGQEMGAAKDSVENI